MKKNLFSLRERKYGDKKFEVLNLFLGELENDNIQNISIEKICDQARISKVTFFNYFNSKEEVLYYYIHLWQYRLSYSVYKREFSGCEGVLSVFKSITNEPFAINFMLALIQYFIKLDKPPLPMEISEYEYLIFCENAYKSNVNKLSLYEIFASYLNDIPSEKLPLVIENITSILYGVPITAHITNQSDNLYKLYKQMVDEILNI